MEFFRQHRTWKYSVRLILILAVTTLFSVLLGSIGVGKENTLMLFMVGVLLITACTYGYQYGVIASVLSVMIFNYFFTVPLHTFAITNTNDVVLIVFFLTASVISSTLTVRFQKQLLLTRQNEQMMSLLYEMSEKFINVTGKENIIELGIRYIYDYTKYESSVELSDETVVDTSGGKYTSRDYLMFPIIGLTKQIGILKVFNHNQGLLKEQELLVKTAANQIGIALDRELIYREQEATKVEVEREHMKSKMLRSISHDFRTPLTGIIGDCGLILDANELDEAQIRQLVSEISEQAVWLTKMMENILNMTKIESGQLNVKKQMEVIDDIVSEAITHVVGLQERRKFEVSLPDEVVTASMDGKMMEQVLINLLDNAMKHTDENGKITLAVFEREGRIYFQVEDDGEGIAEEIKGRLFDEFASFSEKHADYKRGIGLGLAICKAVIEEHGGKIWAENRVEGGARFIFYMESGREK